MLLLYKKLLERNDAVDILKLLAAQGIEVPQDKQEVLKTAFDTELGKVTRKLEAERDTLRESLQTAQDTLKTFEGVDVKDLQGKVAALTETLETKEMEYQDKLADMEFNSVLDSAILASKAKNAKALKALLDVEKLKTSKNQAEDVKAAIEAVKGENDFLFESNEPIMNPVKETNGGQMPPGVTKELFAKMGYADRLKLKKSNPEKYKEMRGN